MQDSVAPGKDHDCPAEVSNLCKDSAVLRIATLNVQNLSPNFAQVVDLMQSHDIDILCLQEVRAKLDCRPALVRAAHRLQWHLLFSQDEEGFLAILSRIPIEASSFHDPISASADTQVLTSQPGRLMTVRVPRHDLPPLVLCNTWGHANNPQARDTLHQALFAEARRWHVDYLLLGDWKSLESEGAVGRALANGLVYSLNDSFTPVNATRNGGNRNIDFGLGNLFALERGQCPGPRDHDLVWYGFPATRVPCFVQPKEFLFWTFSICSSTSFVDMRPRKRAAAVR